MGLGECHDDDHEDDHDHNDHGHGDDHSDDVNAMDSPSSAAICGVVAALAISAGSMILA